jgi:outer membrane PBP1 activator LpoA protein
MTSQEIYARLQESANDNKKLWALSQEFEALYRKLSKAQEQVKIVTTASVDLEDKDGLRKAVLEHLFTESERGNAQASDKLAKLAGLGEEKQDIIIEVVDYSKAAGRETSNYHDDK